MLICFCKLFKNYNKHGKKINSGHKIKINVKYKNKNNTFN